MSSYIKCGSAERLPEEAWRICGKLVHLCHLVEGAYDPEDPDELEPDELEEEGEVDDEELEFPPELAPEPELEPLPLADPEDPPEPAPEPAPEPDSPLRESVR